MRHGGAALAFLAVAWATAPGQTTAPVKGKVERIKVHGRSLEGNLEGDSPDRDVSVYLPPGYASSPARQYPVVYVLHGYTDSDDRWFGLARSFVNLPAAIEAALGKGTAQEMIVVMPNAYTRYAGSFYGNSAATGDWESFVTKDLVEYIDSHYRTLAAPASRGLAGHSMGGYGAVRLAMRSPQTYSSIYVLSACCLDQPLPSAESVQKAEAVRTKEDFDKADFGVKSVMSLAAAWSANPKSAPLFFDMPYKDGKLRPEIVAQWHANSPVAMVGQYASRLKGLHALAIDIGLQDPLRAGDEMLDRLLTEQGVVHSFETYEGTHTSKIGERLETKVFPYFTKNLKF